MASSGDLRRPASTDTRDESAALAATLKVEGISGVLYYSDPSDECRLGALTLPALEVAPAPKLRSCRFELPPNPEPSSTFGDATWSPSGRFAASCHRGRVQALTPDGIPIQGFEGCAPAWKPNGILTFIRRGEIWGVRMSCLRHGARAARRCERTLVDKTELIRAARALGIVPPDPRYLGRVVATDVAWVSDARAAVLMRVHLRRRLITLGPQTALALFDGRRLLKIEYFSAPTTVRVSPRRTFIGVIEAGGQLSVLDRWGDLRLGTADVPSPQVRALTWSPNEQWTAVATRWSVFLIRTPDSTTGGDARTIRLPLVARDVAWR